MARRNSMIRWCMAVAVAGVFTGGTMGLGAQPQADIEAAGGCKCTISGDGTGKYDCATPAVCGPGVWSCNAQCGDPIKPE